MENPIKMDDLGYHYFWKHVYHPIETEESSFATVELILFPPKINRDTVDGRSFVSPGM